MNRLPICIFFAFVLFTGASHAQVKLAQIADPIASKMEWYGVKMKPSGLFVHFDKNIYTGSEHVWFTAYLLSLKNNRNDHHTLAVAVIRNEDSAVVSLQKFVMQQGMAFGHFAMPDTLTPGNYSFLVFTNLLSENKPVASFVQPVTVKSAMTAGFTATLKWAEKIMPGSDSAKLSFKAFAKDIKTLASFADVSYTLGKQQRHFKTDLFGDASFSVSLKDLNRTNNRLKLKASFKNEVKKLQLSLPVTDNQPVVKFFPEGGSLTPGNKTVVGWEVSDAYGQPLEISGILFANGKPVDTIQTNGYGMGRFILAAGNGIQYQVQLVRSGVLYGNYVLPPVGLQGISLSVANSVCEDTLVLHAEDSNHGSYYGMIHNYTEHFFSFNIDLTLAPIRTFRVPLKDIPTGIHTVTILDSLGRPVAERLFFAHYGSRPQIELKTDKTEYGTRENVKMSLALKDASGEPFKGVVSVACVQDNRIDPWKMTDIETFAYLNDELSNIPFKKNAMTPTADNIRHLEDILLIKGWRRYTWPDLMTATANDTVQSFSEAQFKGNVALVKKKITKPMQLSVLSDNGINLLETDKEGKFELSYDQLITPPDKRLLVFVDGKAKEDYVINLEDPYQLLSEKLSTGLAYEDFDAGILEKNSETLVLKKGERAEMLQEVTVTANKKDNSFFAGYQKNECGDYVCMYNVLNCPNHPFGGKLPEKGKTYKSGAMGASITIYAGCLIEEKEKNHVKGFKGIYTAREFYQADYTKLAPSEEVFLSTVFWNYAVPVDTGQPAELSFHTSDIAGKFRIVVQGVTTNGVVYAEHTFNVSRRVAN